MVHQDGSEAVAMHTLRDVGSDPKVAALPDGRFVIVWVNNCKDRPRDTLLVRLCAGLEPYGTVSGTLLESTPRPFLAASTAFTSQEPLRGSTMLRALRLARRSG